MAGPTLNWPNWIGVVVKNLEGQRAFYRDVLGLSEVGAGDGWVHFDMGFPNLLELIQRSDEPEYDRPRFQPGFAVPEIRAARDALIARGAVPISEIDGGQDAQGYWCYFRDPEGNIFEISQRLGVGWAPSGLPAGEAPAAVTVHLMRGPTPYLVYEATLLFDDGDHVVVRAPWQEKDDRDVGYVRFERGDVWTEHYWRTRWYAVKEIRRSNGSLKGWYCDITRPANLVVNGLYSEDLELDLWVSADGQTILRLDEDEFDASGLATRDPDAATAALRALEDLVGLARRGFRETTSEGDERYADVPFSPT